MSKHPVVVSTIAAALTSALTIGIWTSIAPASAAPTNVQVVSKVSFADVIGSSVTAGPGEVGEGEATCPGAAWHAVSGGYLISGKEGPAVASAVDNFPIKLRESPGWFVAVANPKGATSSVTFKVKVRCESEVFRSVAG